jgi:osmotically-inducible protein OsmY
MSADDLAQQVHDELVWDPRVDNEAIAISADDGCVTPRGTVGSFIQKREANRVAESVNGVKGVKDELTVRVLNEDRRSDAELRGSVLQALMLDSLVPSTIDASVDDGAVTLTGTATWHFQREEAESVAGKVRGVITVDDQVKLIAPGPSADDVAHSIKRAMVRSARLDAESVDVDSTNGTITLRGTVSSWADHNAAVAAACAAPGVTRVKDHILVAY